MNPKQFESVCKLSADDRYFHFIGKIADFEELWTLKSIDGFVLYGDNNNRELIPVWPHPDYANVCKGVQWQDCEPFRIDVYLFLEKWIPRMNRDNKLLAIFPTSGNQGVILPPETLRKDLAEELKQYEQNS